jgi:hypothetical protein
LLSLLGAALLVPALSAGAMVVTSQDSDASTMSLCSSKASGAPNKWGPVSKECSYTSPPSNWRGKLKITWSVQPGTTQRACLAGRMGKAHHQHKWQSLGCGTSGSGTIKWPRNTASNVEVRVKSQNLAALAIVEYHI